MEPALWAAKTGLDAQQTRMAVTANNLANVSTTGFKKGRAVFEDLLYQNVRQVGAAGTQDTQLPSGLSLGTGARVVATEKLHTQGNMQVTGNSLDLAINGRGFFQVLLPDGTTGYTRDGALHLNAEGKIVTGSGNVLLPEISVPNDAMEIAIDPEGRVNVRTAGSPDTSTLLGQITLHRFVNPSGMLAVGANVLRPSEASGAPITNTPGQTGLGLLKQGFVERSNVQIVNELVNLIVAQRAYEVNSRAIQASDQMLSTATNLSR